MRKGFYKIAAIAAMAGLLTLPQMALAATADGTGPFADKVIAFSQGKRKDGSAVLASRSDKTDVLGAAESPGTPTETAVEGTFTALGFGGKITLKFQNGIINGPGNDLRVFEVTNASYPAEKVKVEASKDGYHWVTLSASVTRDGDVDLGKLKCAQYVRLTDVSDKALFDAAADGYDADAVKALHSSTKGCGYHTY